MDSNDRDRVVEARDELHRMLNEVPDCFFALCWFGFSVDLKFSIMRSTCSCYACVITIFNYFVAYNMCRMS